MPAPLAADAGPLAAAQYAWRLTAQLRGRPCANRLREQRTVVTAILDETGPRLGPADPPGLLPRNAPLHPDLPAGGLSPTVPAGSPAGRRDACTGSAPARSGPSITASRRGRSTAVIRRSWRFATWPAGCNWPGRPSPMPRRRRPCSVLESARAAARSAPGPQERQWLRLHQPRLRRLGSSAGRSSRCSPRSGCRAINGACEAGIGAAKRRTEYLAARHGRDLDWSANDLYAAQLWANESTIPAASPPARRRAASRLARRSLRTNVTRFRAAVVQYERQLNHELLHRRRRPDRYVTSRSSSSSCSPCSR